MSELERRLGGSSFLVRLWREPRSHDSSHAPPRVYVRDLRSGEERYLKSVEALAAFLEQRHPGRRPDVAGGRRDTGGGRRRAG